MHLGLGSTYRTWSLQPTAPRHRPIPHPPTPPSSENRSPFAASTLPTVTNSGSSIARTRLSGSTVWGPGALTGKLLKRLGENVERGAEYVVIRTQLSKMEKMQPTLLGSEKRLTDDETLEMEDQCRKLVDLCIVGYYPFGLMTRAFSIILRGFQLPGRQIWSYHISEAISKRDIMDVFDLFQETFFVLLDDRSFRITGVVDLETLRFRCPAIAHQIATVVSLLARKDLQISSPTVPIVPTISTQSLYSGTGTAVGDSNPEMLPTYSRAIIEAGFFRLVKDWVKHGLPHWDRRGMECLEGTIGDVADAQEYHGDLNTAEEARDLVRQLRGKRLLLDDIEEMPLRQTRSWLDGVEELPEPDETEEMPGRTR